MAGQVLGALGGRGGGVDCLHGGLLLNEVYGFSGVLAFHSFMRRGIMIIICLLFASLHWGGEEGIDGII